NETELPSPASLLYKIILKGKKLPKLSEDNVDSNTDTESDTESNVESSKEKEKKAKPKLKIAQNLSDLIIYCVAVKFKENSMYYHLSSLSSNASSRLIESEKDAFIRHNARQLTRIYPSGLRIDSSNYKPHNHWI
ncbi:31379_t:CDS:2, partial [Racocetra persica]